MSGAEYLSTLAVHELNSTLKLSFFQPKTEH